MIWRPMRWGWIRWYFGDTATGIGTGPVAVLVSGLRPTPAGPSLVWSLLRTLAYQCGLVFFITFRVLPVAYRCCLVLFSIVPSCKYVVTVHGGSLSFGPVAFEKSAVGS